MAIVYTDTLGNFHKNLSHIPDLLAGREHLDTFRKTAQYRAWTNSLLYLSRELMLKNEKNDCGDFR